MTMMTDTWEDEFDNGDGSDGFWGERQELQYIRHMGSWPAGNCAPGVNDCKAYITTNKARLKVCPDDEFEWRLRCVRLVERRLKRLERGGNGG